MSDFFNPVPKPTAPAKLQRKRSKARGKYAEKAVSEELGGRRTAFSGAGVNEKGDVKVEGLPKPLFIEVKYVGDRVGRAAGSITFPREWMQKTLLDAEAAGQLPVVALRFANDADTLYVTHGKYFQQLIDQLKQFYTEARG